MSETTWKIPFRGLLVAVIAVLLLPVEAFVLALVLPWLLVGGYAGPLIITIMGNLLVLAYLHHRRGRNSG